MSARTMQRRYPRFEAYVSVQCTPMSSGRLCRPPLSGKTRYVGAGGLMLLLAEAIPVTTPVLTQLPQEEPVRGVVVWADHDIPTHRGTAIPHGVAFSQPVDSTVVRRWVGHAERQAHLRVPVRFGVEYVQAGATGRGTCLDLSRGGMFIATVRPAQPGAEVLLHFRLPSLSEAMWVLSRVVWARQGEPEATVHKGMGVQFVDLRPSEGALIGSVVDRFRGTIPAQGDAGPSHPSTP
ncbi:MAG: TIGR02266 family protein [Candidatus Methylomirabilales bacterium]